MHALETLPMIPEITMHSSSSVKNIPYFTTLAIFFLSALKIFRISFGLHVPGCPQRHDI